MVKKIKLAYLKVNETGGHICIPCKIKDCDYLLIIDTGASDTVFDQNLPDAFFSEKTSNNLLSHHITKIDETVYSAVIPEITIGANLVKNLPVKLIDLSSLKNLLFSKKIPEIAGLIGSDFLFNHQAKIDYKGMILKISL